MCSLSEVVIRSFSLVRLYEFYCHLQEQKVKETFFLFIMKSSYTFFFYFKWHLSMFIECLIYLVI